jgi:hypothetical protein
MTQKLWLPIYAFRLYNLHQYFRFILPAMLHRIGQFHEQLIIWFNRFIFSEEFCNKVLFFAHRGHLQALKICDLKLLCLESIVRFKRQDNQSRNLNWKIWSEREQKFSGYINSPSGYQYRIFTRILQK